MAITILAPDTLGLPNSDSEAHNCYLSEKGLQAVPVTYQTIHAGTGRYLAKFNLNSEVYYILDNNILDSAMNIIEFNYSYFDSNGVYTDKGLVSIIPDNLFEYKINGKIIDEIRSIKTISYQTITNSTLTLLDIAKDSIISFKVNNNVLCYLSCSILIFFSEDEYSNLTLQVIKNPVLCNTVDDNITETYNLGVYHFRSYIPGNRIDSDAGFTLSTPQPTSLMYGMTDDLIPSTDQIGPMTLKVCEDLTVIYDKTSRAIKAVRQIRRTVAGDYNYPKSGPGGPGTSFTNNELDYGAWQVALDKINYNSTIPNDWDCEQINKLYVYGDAPTWPPSDLNDDWDFGNGGTIRGNAGADPFSIASIGFPSWIQSTTSSIMLPLTTSAQIQSLDYRTVTDNTVELYAMITFTTSASNQPTPSGFFVTSNTSIGKWVGCNTTGIVINKDTTIDDIFGRYENISKAMAANRIFTPDTAKYNEGTIGNSWSGVMMNYSAIFAYAQILVENREAEIWANQSSNSGILSFFTGQFFWAQRNRLFSIGTKYITNNLITTIPQTTDNPVEMDNAPSISINKFAVNELLGNATGNLLYNEDPTTFKSLIGFDNLNRLYYQIYNWPNFYIRRMIFTWVPSTAIDSTIEYENAVYFTGIGNVGIVNADNQYFVPSNVNAQIIGLWGQDRNLFCVSNKGVEQFNISDNIEVSPMSFNKVEKLYDTLCDWTGVNNRLDLLYKTMNSFFLNDLQRIKEIYNLNWSRFAPDTTYKQINFTVIDNLNWLGDPHWRIFDSENREFKIDPELPIHSLSNIIPEAVIPGKVLDIYVNNDSVLACRIDQDNKQSFDFAWTWRPSKTEYLRKIMLEKSAYDTTLANEKSMVKLWRHGKLLGERYTTNYAVSFFKIGKMNSARLKIETDKYVKQVTLVDTEVHQK